MDIPIK